MSLKLLIEGIIIGIVVAVPVGPLGILCLNRALALGALCGLFSGLGVATADGLAAGLAALGITLVSAFLVEHQMVLRLVGGFFLCYLGFKIYRTTPNSQPPPSNVSGLFSAYATAFFLTFSNPVTIVSFVAIYAGWGVESLRNNYLGAALFALGVFTGSALWWIAMFISLTLCHNVFSARTLGRIHKLSGTIILGFGVIVLLSLSPIRAALGLRF